MGLRRETMRSRCAMMGSWYARRAQRQGRKSDNREVIENFTARGLSFDFVFSIP